ncbi:two-component system response regulator [Massilia sp. Root351]|jgi:two-component system phosphate regulon response regulator PhoB|uniref:response regulator n=1 Tax=Massilia sp. Root351 TaxID=1736522 RepID=UPI000710F33A|nr:response regulator [Massilia sp. Root351]KQV90344.1 two-component system response regulator [Massilia sp. Root351]
MGFRVMVVEDEPAIQALIAASLSGYEVRCAGSAEAALLLLAQATPDLVLLDWGLPGQSGIDLLCRLRAHGRTRALPVIMLTARSQQQDLVFALECGADDYVAKPFSPRELRARVQVQLPRQPGMELNGLQLDPESQSVSAGAHDLALGPAEFSLLRHFMRYPERTHTRAALLAQVWGNDSTVNERAVDTRVRRLRQALHASGHHAMIETVRGDGYRLTVPR